MLISSSSTISTCLHPPNSSENCAFYKGILRCTCKSGIPCFVFLVDIDEEEVYVANLLKFKSTLSKIPDYIYLFHSVTRRKGGFNANASRLVGKMNVSSCLVFNSNRSKHTESEFILFSVGENLSEETKKLEVEHMKSNMPSKKLVHTRKTNSNASHGKSSLDLDAFLSEMDELNQLNGSDYARILKDNPHPTLELAAIIVKDYRKYNKKTVTTGGWGLKFLEKFAESDADSSSASLITPKRWEQDESLISMDVIIPAGFHSSSVSWEKSPSSLVERWRCGGCCDCGGWDVGCPLIILTDHNICKKCLGEALHEDFHKFDLFTKGKKKSEPTLKMVKLDEGLYDIYVQSDLSALQSFALGLSIIHSQTPSLCPRW